MSSRLYKAFMPTARDDVNQEAVERALDEIVKYEAECKRQAAIERASEDMIPRNGAVMTMLERVCASRTSDEIEPQTRLGFLRMFDPAYRTYVGGESIEPHLRIPWGFQDMLESAFPSTPTTPTDKPRVVHRGMGFAAMLEGARRGTE